MIKNKIIFNSILLLIALLILAFYLYGKIKPENKKINQTQSEISEKNTLNNSDLQIINESTTSASSTDINKPKIDNSLAAPIRN